MLTMFLVVTFFVLWLVVVDRSQQGIVDGLIMSILIGVTSYFCFLAGREDAQGSYLLLENIKKGTCFKVISPLEIPNKKPHCFYVIELQDGTFPILSLENEKWEDADRVLQVGKSYYVDITKGSLVRA